MLLFEPNKVADVGLPERQKKAPAVVKDDTEPLFLN
jgi:hypothetical protein